MVMPLAVLADKLTLGPPALGALVDILDKSEIVQKFLELVREYLPEYEREMMSLDNFDRVERFKRLFEERYFPLADFGFDDEETMYNLVYTIPIMLGGITYEEYHEFDNYRDGHILLLSLVIYPYVTLGDGGAIASRVPLLEEVAEKVGKELAERIPPEGWEPKLLHEVCDGSRFAGVADFADWVCSCTETWVLDTNYEEYGEEAWDREIVDELTAQWQRVVQIQDRLMNMSVWLEESPKARFEEMLNFILGKLASQVPKEQLPLQNGPKTLLEVFSEEDAREGIER